MKKLSFCGVFWLAYMVIIIAIACGVRAAFGANLRFTWEPNTDGTEGYRIMMDGRAVKNIPGRESATTVLTVPDDTSCHSFTLLAYAGGVVSDPSNYVTWCPVPEKPAAVRQLTITVQVEQQ